MRCLIELTFQAAIRTPSEARRRFVEPVVAPEQLVAERDRGDAEHAPLVRRLGGFTERLPGAIDVEVAGERADVGRVAELDAPLEERAERAQRELLAAPGGERGGHRAHREQ